MRPFITCSFLVIVSIFYFAFANEIDPSIETLSLPNFNHKSLFPLDFYDYLGIVLISLGLLIAASGGIGGGGIVVPLLILVLGFQPKHAVALSNFTILGSSITNMILNVYKVHPIARRPLVDWDLILVMEPLTMAGAVVGAIVGKILPDWILTLLLVILLGQTTFTTVEKARSQYKKETDNMNMKFSSIIQKVIEEEDDEAENEMLLSQEDDANFGTDSLNSATSFRPVDEKSSLTSFQNDHKGQEDDEDDVEDDERDFNTDEFEKDILIQKQESDEVVMRRNLKDLLDRESKTPIDRVTVMSTMVLIVVGLNLLKGGGSKFPSIIGIECNSSVYWWLTGAILLYILSVSLWARNQLVSKWKLKKELRYRYIDGDVEWNPINTIVYPCICFFAGFFAGMFGIGGGVVKGPLMLQMGVHPLVASATVAVMIMFTSVSATAMFIVFGTLQWDYAWCLFIVGLLSTTIGQFGVSYLVDKYKRYSYISMSIGAVVAISTILMGLQSIFELTESGFSPTGGESDSLC